MPEWITFFGSHRRAHAALTLDIGSYVAEPRVRAPYSASGIAGKPALLHPWQAISIHPWQAIRHASWQAQEHHPLPARRKGREVKIKYAICPARLRRTQHTA